MRIFVSSIIVLLTLRLIRQMEWFYINPTWLAITFRAIKIVLVQVLCVMCFKYLTYCKELYLNSEIVFWFPAF